MHTPSLSLVLIASLAASSSAGGVAAPEFGLETYKADLVDSGILEACDSLPPSIACPRIPSSSPTEFTAEEIAVQVKIPVAVSKSSKVKNSKEPAVAEMEQSSILLSKTTEESPIHRANLTRRDNVYSGAGIKQEKRWRKIVGGIAVAVLVAVI